MTRTSVAMGVALAVLLLAVAMPLAAQAPVARAGQAPVVAQPAPPPATKLEAFKPGFGAVGTLGFDEIGSEGMVFVQAQELRSGRLSASGLLVDIRQVQYHREQAYVDIDEIPELLKGIDALLAIKANPTQFKNFEARYVTRGEMLLTAYNDPNGKPTFAIQTGHITKARMILSAGELAGIRELFAKGMKKLDEVAAAK